MDMVLVFEYVVCGCIEFVRGHRYEAIGAAALDELACGEQPLAWKRGGKTAAAKL